jgi:hypothetical protein
MSHAAGEAPRHGGESMSIRTVALIAVIPAVFGLAACGADGGDDGVASAAGGGGTASASPSQSLDPEEARLKFAQCMRQHGIDMPDPDGSGKVTIKGRPGDEGKMQAAMKACQHFQQQAGGRLGNPNDPKVRDQMLKFAQCMRQHGINVPDPQPGQGLQFRVNKGSEAKMEAAQKACQQYAPGGGDKSKTSVGGGGS